MISSPPRPPSYFWFRCSTGTRRTLAGGSASSFFCSLSLRLSSSSSSSPGAIPHPPLQRPYPRRPHRTPPLWIHDGRWCSLRLSLKTPFTRRRWPNIPSTRIAYACICIHHIIFTYKCQCRLPIRAHIITMDLLVVPHRNQNRLSGKTNAQERNFYCNINPSLGGWTIHSRRHKFRFSASVALPCLICLDGCVGRWAGRGYPCLYIRTVSKRKGRGHVLRVRGALGAAGLRIIENTNTNTNTQSPSPHPSSWSSLLLRCNGRKRKGEHLSSRVVVLYNSEPPSLLQSKAKI